jgi:hypothetical protein
MRREPLSAKEESVAVNSQIDRGVPALRCASPDFSALTWPGPEPEMPLWKRLLIDGVCGGSRVIDHARFCGAKICHHSSFSSGWSVRLAVCGTRRAEYAKPF